MANAIPLLFLPGKDSIISEVPLEYAIEAIATADLEAITTSTLSSNTENDTYTTTQMTSSPVAKLCKAGRLYLQEVNVSLSCDLTPKCKKFYKTILNCSNKIHKWQYKIKNVQCRLANAGKFKESDIFNNSVM